MVQELYAPQTCLTRRLPAQQISADYRNRYRTDDELQKLLVPALAHRIKACEDTFFTWAPRWWVRIFSPYPTVPRLGNRSAF